MSILLIASLSLNAILVMGYVYHRHVARVANRKLARVVNEQLMRILLSTENPILHSAMMQIFPGLDLPRDLVENQHHIRAFVEHIVAAVSPYDIVHRFRTLPVSEDLDRWLAGVSGHIQQFDLRDAISTAVPNILRQVLNAEHSIQSFIIACPHGLLSRIKNSAIPTEAFGASVCQCGRIEIIGSVHTCTACTICASPIQIIRRSQFEEVRQLLIEDIPRCPITLEEFSPATKIGILSCGHYAEYTALLNWTKVNYRCHYLQCQIKPIVDSGDE